MGTVRVRQTHINKRGVRWINWSANGNQKYCSVRAWRGQADKAGPPPRARTRGRPYPDRMVASQIYGGKKGPWNHVSVNLRPLLPPGRTFHRGTWCSSPPHCDVSSGPPTCDSLRFLSLAQISVTVLGDHSPRRSLTCLHALQGRH